MKERNPTRSSPAAHGAVEGDGTSDPETGHRLSIWFFCGILLLGCGVILVGQGVYERFGHEPPTVLANLQPTLWWGVILTALGGVYTVRFRPGLRGD